MLEQHIANLILDQLPFQPTDSQSKLIVGLGQFVTSPDEDCIMLIKGYAGTGKTFMVSALVKVLADMQINTLLMAPTGRAAKVFSTYALKPAYTIHKMIYRQKTSGDGMGSFSLNFNKHKDTLFIVDEASMIANSSSENSIFGSGRLLDDLLEFVQQGSNCKLILIGDSAQLPPIGFAQSPALDKTILESYGYQVIEFFLNQVVRQTEDSGILKNATILRESLTVNASLVDVPLLCVEGFNDIQKVSGEDLIETISTCYNKFGMENTIIINRSNKRASQYNKGVRASILSREEELTKGDYLMVVKNNYFWTEKLTEIEFIANGDIAEVIKIYGYEELYDFRFANVLVRLIDHGYLEIELKILLDNLASDNASLSKEQGDLLYKSVMADYADLPSKRKQFEAIRKNPFFNALQVKYGYAITCHKSQGGQWNAVFIDQGMVRDEDKGIEYVRWLYTAMTRATDKLYLVNFPKTQFKE